MLIPLSYLIEYCPTILKNNTINMKKELLKNQGLFFINFNYLNKLYFNEYFVRNMRLHRVFYSNDGLTNIVVREYLAKD